jgi:uncharacterized membrane protein
MDVMNLAHLHLLLNHVPTVGTVMGLGLLLLALVRRNDHLTHVSFEVFFVIALLTMPAYLTGVAAQQILQGRPDVSDPLMVVHHDAALQGFILMQLTGGAAWLGLWQFRRRARPERWMSAAVLVLAVLTAALMARAANIGGEIHHPEIRVEQAAEQAIATNGGDAAAPGWLTSAAVQQMVTGTPWVWPLAETLHFIGLCLVFGVLTAVNLRLLGLMKGLPFALFHRLLPWSVLGFGLNLATGMLFFIAAPDQYTENVSFYWKIGFLLVAGVDVLYLTVFRKAYALEPGDDSRFGDKVIAASAIGAWVGVIVFGRLLPFLGNAF